MLPLFVFVAALVSSSVYAGVPVTDARAIVKIIGVDVAGNATFTQKGKTLVINGIIEGLKPSSKHGFHIHEKGDITSGCGSTGPHYNPFNKKHGGPKDQERHVGDLGNIETDDRGIANFVINDHLASLTGDYSILGRAIVVHSDADDLGKGGHDDSLTTGHAGSRIACGIIGTLELGQPNSATSFSSVSSYVFTLLMFSIFLR